jgi:hypothetical protein
MRPLETALARVAAWTLAALGFGLMLWSALMRPGVPAALHFLLGTAVFAVGYYAAVRGGQS